MVALLAATACAAESGGEPGSGVAPNPRAPVQELFRERAAALNAGDVEGYLTPLSPAARTVEEPMARNAVTMPVERFDMTIGRATISNDGTTFRDAEVELRFNYEGLPEDNPFRICLEYDMELQEGRWVVTRAELEGGRSGCSYAPLWALGPVEMVRTPRFLVFSQPGLAPRDDTIALIEPALAELVGRLPLEADPSHVVFLVDTATMEDVYESEDAVAFATWSYRSSSAYPIRPEDRQAVVDAEFLLAPGREALIEGEVGATAQQVLEHELAHLALARFTRPPTPDWVVEGAAMLLAEQRLERFWREMAADGSLEGWTLEDLESDVPSVPAYAYANAAVLVLAEEAGSPVFFDFYQNFKEFVDEPGAPASRSEGAERLLRRHYGFGIDELDQRTRDWIRRAVA